ncbi:uncharacterized protein [Coffea arabica]|uniref:Uncharacterized protein isoform X1 n=1 Tax=Coffea arabica TaxID=13443 RepID=A0ABM4VJX9_COFAR
MHQPVPGSNFQLPLVLPPPLKLAFLGLLLFISCMFGKVHLRYGASSDSHSIKCSELEHRIIQFADKLQANCPSASRKFRTSMMRSSCLTSTSRIGGLPSLMTKLERRFFLSVANGDRVMTDNGKNEFNIANTSDSDEQSSATDLPLADSLEGGDEIQSKAEGGSVPKLSDVNNGSLASINSKEESPSSNQTPAIKRSPLTARERLRAARVLRRYTESKASKPELGSKLLDALKESDKGKRSGLPEAPANLFDDSKRGMPKPGWTFEFPGGFDLFLIVFSFVFISTVMFATTYIVWKLGGIHFNEY